jgi:hypothetical protein
MSFQFVIDNAETMGVSRRPVVASTLTRSGLVRTVSRGNSLWRFTVRLPDGPRWTDYRPYITAIEKSDRFVAEDIQFNNSGYDWMFAYQGDFANISGTVTVTIPSPRTNTVTIASAPTLASGYRFRKGDLIQLTYPGPVYVITEDVAYNQNTITLHRPILDPTSGVVTARIGENCIFSLQMIEFPQWSFIARDQIGWSGDFVFQEAVTWSI